MRRRSAALAGALLALPLIGASPVAALDLGFEGLRSSKGLIRLCLTPNPAKFPSCAGDPRAIERSMPASTRTLRFDGLPAGDWAVAVIHDANSNGRLDTSFGIPVEGFGFSRNPPLGFGAPKFAAARFRLDADHGEPVRFRYLL